MEPFGIIIDVFGIMKSFVHIRIVTGAIVLTLRDSGCKMRCEFQLGLIEIDHLFHGYILY